MQFPEGQTAPLRQATHAPPSTPHELVEAVLHKFPEQQPDGQDVPVHRHVPLTHCWPAAQIPPSPQAQAPPAHRLDRTGSHGKQLEPSAPQFATEGARHCLLLSQQPPAHDDGSHTQLLERHSCPPSQEGALPHRHSPLEEQLLASCAGHA